MRISNDRELVRRSLRGDADAFATLVEQYSASVFGLSYGRLLHHADAEDVTQDTFLRAYEKLGQLREPDRFESWVHRIAMTLAYDRFRLRARETPMDTRQLLRDTAAESDEHDAFEREADAERLMEPALRTLPEHLRVAFVMLHLTGASYATLARRLHISPMAAERRVQRARDRLRQYFRRRDASTAMRSLAIAAPVGDEFLARIHETWRQGSPPTQYAVETSSSAHSFGLIAAGVAATMVFFASVYGAHMRHLRWSDLRQLGDTTYVEPVAVVLLPSAFGEAIHVREAGRELIQPGDEHLGWAPLQPARDSTPVHEQRRYVASQPTGAVLSNDEGLFRAFEPTWGEVTLEIWVSPPTSGTNFGVGFMLDGAAGSALLYANETGYWLHSTDGVHERRVAPVHSAGQTLRVVYSTASGRYDLWLGGRRVLEDETRPGLGSRAVTGVWLASGRGGKGAATYFDDLSVTVRDDREGTLARAVGGSRLRDRMTLNDGVINGTRLDVTNPTISVRAGESISGWLTVTVVNNHHEATRMPVVETPTWGDHAGAYREVGSVEGASRRELRVDVSRVAPNHPGDYHIIIAAAPETDAAFVASGTNHPLLTPRWNNTTDIAAWPASVANQTRLQGYATIPWAMDDHVGIWHIPAVCVRVEVRGSGGPEATALTPTAREAATVGF